MAVDMAPPPPTFQPQKGVKANEGSNIEDKREEFARKLPQTPEDRAKAREFIEHKIQILRSDPNLTDAEKAAAIEELKAKR